jgi:8-oxo-dGTP pyrophosphatase MutT (NUDIX family)
VIPAVEVLLDRVSTHRPHTRGAGDGGFHAATALVLTREPDPRMVVIHRASRAGDPWSGHAALPGGRHEPQDEDLATTARRETAEEVGLALDDPVGRLDDIGGRTHLGVVSPFVFAVERAIPLVPEPGEVAAAHWVPLRVLVDPVHRTRHPSRRVGPWPAWSWSTGLQPPLDDLVIWGLTHRTLTNFLEVTGLR